MMVPCEAIFLPAFEAHRCGHLQEAEAGYRRVLKYDPRHADALHLLGLIHAGRGALPEAAALMQQAVGIAPTAVYFGNLGDVLRQQGLHAAAEAACRRAIQLKHDHAPAHFNLGLLFMATGRRDEAEHALRQALTFAPASNDALNNLGVLLQDMGRANEAETAYRRAIGNDPSYLRAHYNLGLLLLRAGRFGEAELAFRNALDIDPAYADAQNDLGTALREQHRYADAEATYRSVLQQCPDFADARWNLALLLLAQGRYAEGWQHAEARYDMHRTTPVLLPDPGYPQWRGEPLAGRSLVICHEQGLGDSIQFARYVPLLKARGLRRLTLFCPEPLQELLKTLEGVDEAVCNMQEVGPHDFWSLSMSLPLHVGTTTANIPARLPYLRALPDRVRRWRTCLPAHGIKVGLVWKGSTSHSHDADRSLPGLLSLAPLWSVPDVTFVSLQKGQGEDEPAALAKQLPMVRAAPDLTDLADTAALVSQLDLVISVDTAVAHLAGALGKPCWLLLHKPWTDWRWMHGRTDSPWYPHVMRIYRQATPGDWAEVIGRIAVALEQYAQPTVAS
ncbi:tetratricopeptide (TPR) repeat protein [Paraburkholderia sp. HC6.4b]|uniref:tetratricopeptide repeat protein n=1 Tax=unclassified Paraburkholderia TaxID=2615204 RepID=UPI0016166969|nr:MULTISPECIES: tetratricopeptide repeat protein [unclassified Paraburkholderia]MBB5408770.1 tetratricopeptide (TPR) repeat protein [Paraburkholderia sp. HC6.4b]MBB5455395.1 tetratricopeptide (TPR) repeat protein [Paraburkholderia sp. Kb1A]